MWFEKTYCINLDSRTDRWEESQAEFDKIGLKAERFSGIPGNFNQSQLSVIKKASKHNSSLILEDDVEFRDVSHVQSALDQVKDWDLISFGATLNSKHKDRVGENLYRYKDGWATHAVAYSQKLMKWIVLNFDPNGGVIYDEWLRINVLPKFECFIIYPMVSYQRPSFSDLRNRFTDYTNGFKQSEALFA